MRGGQDVLILTIPLDLRRSLWYEVRGRPGQPPPPRRDLRTVERTQSYKRGQTGASSGNKQPHLVLAYSFGECPNPITNHQCLCLRPDWGPLCAN